MVLGPIGFFMADVDKKNLVYLPISGEGAPVLVPQARSSQMGEDDLWELISSIATHGVLQPILVEVRDKDFVVVAGERRLRALRWLAERHPDNEFVLAGVPSFVVEKTFEESERRSIQVAENLVRADLSVSEMGAALLWVRCGLVVEKLVEEGFSVPDEILSEGNVASKWGKLEEFRIAAGAHGVGAPWSEVIASLGIQLSPYRAQLLARAVSGLPPGVGEEMDARNVSLHSRIKWLKLSEADPERADDLWEQLKEREMDGYLSAAVDAAWDDPSGDIGDIVDSVSGASDIGDDDAANEWLMSKGAAEQAAAETPTEGEGEVEEEIDETVAPSSGKAVGVLRNLLKEVGRGLTVPPKERSQLEVLCEQLSACLVEMSTSDNENLSHEDITDEIVEDSED